MVANLQIVEESKKLSPLFTMLPNVHISKHRIVKYGNNWQTLTVQDTVDVMKSSTTVLVIFPKQKWLGLFIMPQFVEFILNHAMATGKSWEVKCLTTNYHSFWTQQL